MCYSPTCTTQFTLGAGRSPSLPERIKANAQAKRRKRHLSELLARLEASDTYLCMRAQGQRLAARSLRQAVIARWSVS